MPQDKKTTSGGGEFLGALLFLLCFCFLAGVEPERERGSISWDCIDGFGKTMF